MSQAVSGELPLNGVEAMAGWSLELAQKKRPSFASELEQYQSMIDLYTLTISKLRTSNSSTARQEVRTLEGKLIVLFSNQLACLTAYEAAATMSNEETRLLQKYPNVRQWLDVVGLQTATIDALMLRRLRLPDMALLSAEELSALIHGDGGDDEDVRCLRSALLCLKRRTDLGSAVGAADLAWGSMRNDDRDESKNVTQPASASQPLAFRPPVSPNQSPVLMPRANSPSHHCQSALVSARPARSPTPVSQLSTTPLSSTPPSTPGSTRMFVVMTSSGSLRRTSSNEGQFLHVGKAGSTSNLSLRLTEKIATMPNRHRNRSCDALLESRSTRTLESVESTDSGNSTTSPSTTKIRWWSRKHTPKRKNALKQLRDEEFAAIPLSPGPVTMRVGHSIKHRFRSKVFLPGQECDYCHKLMLKGKKCTECKFRCHIKCQAFVPSSCGLPHGYEKFFKMQLLKEEPQSGNRYSYLSSSSSSHHSSLPFPTPTDKVRSVSSISSPLTMESSGGRRLTATLSDGDLLKDLKISHFSVQNGLFVPYPNGQTSPCGSLSPSCSSSASDSPATPHTPLADRGPLTVHPVIGERRSFEFPSFDLGVDGKLPRSQIQQDWVTNGGMLHSSLSPSRRRPSSEMITSSLKRAEGVFSQVPIRLSDFERDFDDDDAFAESSDSFQSSVLASYESEVSSEVDCFHRSLSGRHHRGSLLTEWEIPFGDLKLIRKIAEGKMGDVYQGKWHGFVCVKMLQLADPTDRQLAEFKHEVSILKKTRHENVVLFMGACLSSPNLAIITSYIHGEPLYRLIHDKDEHFTVNRALLIAIQIVHGMGYLHERSIVHKDLRSKNVFLEKGGKVVITDFGLSTVSDEERKKNRRGYLRIPSGHLCYLSPEIVSKLRPSMVGLASVKRSKASDLYAFGILWYELLTGKWPFSRLEPERAIFNIGSGMKPSLGSLKVTQSTRNELGKCLSRDPFKRPSFSTLYTLLDRLPKKSLQRSPSYPTKLTAARTRLDFL